MDLELDKYAKGSLGGSSDTHLIRRLSTARAASNVVPTKSGISSSTESEEVFLAQLHRRSLLLNESYQACVLQLLSKHEAPQATNWTDSHSPGTIGSRPEGPQRYPAVEVQAAERGQQPSEGGDQEAVQGQLMFQTTEPGSGQGYELIFFRQQISTFRH